MLKPRVMRAPKKAPVKNRRVAAPRVEASHIICLNPADSQKFVGMLSRPAREPNDYVKAALAEYHRLVQVK